MSISPRFFSLERSFEFSEPEGVTLRALAPFDTLSVATCNSEYQLFLLDPETGRVLIRGGRFFAEPAEAVVNGATFGGGRLKLGWVGVGLPMEISVNGQLLITSRVCSLRVEHEQDRPPGAAPAHAG